jgi:hypothetical protein
MLARNRVTVRGSSCPPNPSIVRQEKSGASGRPSRRSTVFSSSWSARRSLRILSRSAELTGLRPSQSGQPSGRVGTSRTGSYGGTGSVAASPDRSWVPAGRAVAHLTPHVMCPPKAMISPGEYRWYIRPMTYRWGQSVAPRAPPATSPASRALAALTCGGRLRVQFRPDNPSTPNIAWTTSGRIPDSSPGGPALCSGTGESYGAQI